MQASQQTLPNIANRLKGRLVRLPPRDTMHLSALYAMPPFLAAALSLEEAMMSASGVQGGGHQLGVQGGGHDACLEYRVEAMMSAWSTGWRPSAWSTGWRP